MKIIEAVAEIKIYAVVEDNESINSFDFENLMGFALHEGGARFKLVSTNEVTELSQNDYNWGGAVPYCRNHDVKISDLTIKEILAQKTSDEKTP